MITGTPRQDLCNITDILAHAPTEPQALPAWLEQLPQRQFEVVWLACLEEQHFASGEMPWSVARKVLQVVVVRGCAPRRTQWPGPVGKLGR